MNTRDALCSLFAAAGFVDAVMARAYASSPDEIFVEQLCREGCRGAFGLIDGEGALAQRFEGIVSLAQEMGLEGLKSEFEDAFFGIGAKIHPYESVQASPENMLFQHCTLEVRAAYRSLGLEAPHKANNPDDSLALELDFMQKALMSASDRLAENDVAACQASVGAARAFLDEHLGAWASKFASSFDGTRHEGGFYHAFSQLMADAVAQEKAMLAQISPELDDLLSE